MQTCLFLSRGEGVEGGLSMGWGQRRGLVLCGELENKGREGKREWQRL